MQYSQNRVTRIPRPITPRLRPGAKVHVLQQPLVEDTVVPNVHPSDNEMDRVGLAVGQQHGVKQSETKQKVVG